MGWAAWMGGWPAGAGMCWPLGSRQRGSAPSMHQDGGPSRPRALLKVPPSCPRPAPATHRCAAAPAGGPWPHPRTACAPAWQEMQQGQRASGNATGPAGTREVADVVAAAAQPSAGRRAARPARCKAAMRARVPPKLNVTPPPCRAPAGCWSAPGTARTGPGEGGRGGEGLESQKAVGREGGELSACAGPPPAAPATAAAAGVRSRAGGTGGAPCACTARGRCLPGRRRLGPPARPPHLLARGGHKEEAAVVVRQLAVVGFGVHVVHHALLLQAGRNYIALLVGALLLNI